MMMRMARRMKGYTRLLQMLLPRGGMYGRTTMSTRATNFHSSIHLCGCIHTGRLPIIWGHHAMSKALVPRHVGDTRVDPIRTYMLLKAWALWRANLDGWARARRNRKLQLSHDERVLEEEVRKVGATNPLIDHPKAGACSGLRTSSLGSVQSATVG